MALEVEGSSPSSHPRGPYGGFPYDLDVDLDPVDTRLYLVRHCDVRNPEGVLYGHLPDFPLSEKGVKQAHNLGKFFADKPVKVIYASPLERAQETAKIIQSYLKNVPIITTDELVEAKFGHYLQGVKPKDVPRKRPLWFVHKAWPGLLRRDESVKAMAARVRAPLTRLLRDYPGEGGICVSHGDPIQAFWTRLDGGRRFLRLDCAKGGMLELDYSGSKLVSKLYRAPIPVSTDDVGGAGTAEPDEGPAAATG